MAANPRRRHFRRRRRNPSFATAKDLLTKAGWAVLGGVATRSIPAMVLKEGNTGITGYIANGATAVSVSLLVSRFAGKPAGEMALIGGVTMLAGRVVADVIGAKLVEFGELGPGLFGDRQFDLSGEYVQQSFVMPQHYARALPAAVSAAAMAGPWRPNPWGN